MSVVRMLRQGEKYRELADEQESGARLDLVTCRARVAPRGMSCATRVITGLRAALLIFILSSTSTATASATVPQSQKSQLHNCNKKLVIEPTSVASSVFYQRFLSLFNR